MKPQSRSGGSRIPALARNAGGRLTSDISGIAARTVLVLALARVAGPHELGLLVLATTVGSLALLPAVMGMDVWAAFEGAARNALRPSGSTELPPASEALRLTWVTSGLVGGVLVVAGLASSGTVRFVMVGAGALTLSTAPGHILRAGFSGSDRLRHVGWGGLAEGLVALGTGIVAIWAGLGAAGAVGALVAGRTAGLCVSAVLYVRHVGPLRGSASMTRMDVLRRSSKLAALRPLVVGVQRADALLLGLFLGPVAAGWYGAATNITLTVPLLATGLSEAMLPRLFNTDDRRAVSAGGRLVWMCGLISAPVTIGLLVAAPFAVQLLYGPGYEMTVTAMRVLALSMPLVFVNAALSPFVMSRGRVGARTLALATALVVNVAANLVLIRALGVPGAAWATVASEAAHALALVLCLRGYRTEYRLGVRNGREAGGDGRGGPAAARGVHGRADPAQSR